MSELGYREGGVLVLVVALVVAALVLSPGSDVEPGLMVAVAGVGLLGLVIVWVGQRRDSP